VTCASLHCRCDWSKRWNTSSQSNLFQRFRSANSRPSKFLKDFGAFLIVWQGCSTRSKLKSAAFGRLDGSLLARQRSGHEIFRLAQGEKLSVFLVGWAVCRADKSPLPPTLYNMFKNLSFFFYLKMDFLIDLCAHIVEVSSAISYGLFEAESYLLLKPGFTSRKPLWSNNRFAWFTLYTCPLVPNTVNLKFGNFLFFLFQFF